MKYRRIITIVLDSVGIGETPDSKDFGDHGVNTLGNISKSVGLNIPNLEKMGLGNISPLQTVKEVKVPLANYTKMQSQAKGKDTLAGHWEMMGVTIEKPFKEYTQNGFPKELIQQFEEEIKRKIVGNKAGNGLKMIEEYYQEAMEGKFIIYTSADSTFQIASHEDVISLEELYLACEIARKLTLDPKYNVARVIARPFIGSEKDFERTANRHDYALTPPAETIMQKLVKNNINVTSIGKISDIFNGHGVTTSIKIKDNMDGVDKILNVLKSKQEGFIFANLVDFDSKYGHPRDVRGYKGALEEFDKRIPHIIEELKKDDLLIITADHGNDPTYKGNDHTREYVPLLVYNNKLVGNNKLELRNTFEDLGETIAHNFNIKGTSNGKSFLDELK